jgi:peptide/nickel transport system substrate-binding protein
MIDEPGAQSDHSGWLRQASPVTMTRRQALRAVGAGSGAIALGSFLAACNSGSPASAPTAADSPRHGGTLNAGILGGGAADTVDANNAIAFVDNARVANLYDPLATFSRDMGIELQLAEEISATSKAATSWLIRLRPGVEFHNGKDLTADDVAFTLQRISSQALNGESILSVADTKNIKVLDKSSLIVPMNLPVSIFDQILSTPPLFNIVPVGYDVHHPVGTGPFRYESFTPGQQSAFTRNPNYWDQPFPYADRLVISDVSDGTAQSNGIESGQFNAIDQVAAGAVAGLRSAGLKLTMSDGYSWNPITMRVDRPPFDDVRVRQAFRLMIDRPQALELALGGYGTVANDLFAPFDPTYNHALPQRGQDISEAKALLRSAGYSNLKVTMQTSSAIGVGVLQTAEIFAQDASRAGVTVNLQPLSDTEFYGPNYTKWPFAQDDWSTAFYLVQVWWSMLPTSDYNECHFNNARYNSLAKSALSTLDEGSRADIVHEMQTIEWNEGGYIIPFFTGFVDCVAHGVGGMAPSKVGLPFNDYRFKYLWLS